MKGTSHINKSRAGKLNGVENAEATAKAISQKLLKKEIQPGGREL